MAHIVCITSGLRGLLNASFELLARLRQDGHRITYASPFDVADAVRAQGLAYVQLAPVSFSPSPQPERKTGWLGGIRTRLGEWWSAPQRRKLGAASLPMSEFRSFLNRQSPDLVLIDAELYEHIFTARAAGLPIALLTPFFTTRQHHKVPPLQSDIIPGKGWWGSAPGIWCSWWFTRLARWWQVRIVSLRNAFTERRSVLRLYARQNGFPLRALEQYGWVTLFTINEIPTLSLTAYEVEFPHQREPWRHYVGPMVAIERQETTVSRNDHERLAEVFAERKAHGCPLLYCGLTTMGESDQGLLQRVIEAVSPHPDWLLIIASNGATITGHGSLPNNIHLFDSVPQIAVLKQCDLCITQGGVNTVNECLSLVVPMLIYPTDFADKRGCASRIHFHRLGIRGDTARDDPVVIAARIQQTLADNEIRQNLQSLHGQLQRYRDERVLENLINSLIDPAPDGHRAENAAVASDALRGNE